MARMTPVHWRTLERVFLAAGFRFVRQQGSHRSGDLHRRRRAAHVSRDLWPARPDRPLASLTRVRLRAKRLWQRPLPRVLDVLRELGVV